MEVNDIIILRFDYSLSSTKDSVVSGLEEWYGKEGGSSTFFPQEESFELTYFSYDDNNDDTDAVELEYYNSVETSVVPQTSHFVDIITIGRLSDNPKKTILENDDTLDDLDKWKEELRDITQYVSTITKNDDHACEIIQIIPAEDWHIHDTEGELDESQLYRQLREAQRSLESINYNLMGCISLIRGSGGYHILVPQHPNRIWGPLISIQIKKVDSNGNLLPMLPFWVKTPKLLSPYFRSHQWLIHRNSEIHSLDSETYDISDFFDSNERSSESQLDKLIKAGKGLTEFRRNWTNLYTQILD